MKTIQFPKDFIESKHSTINTAKQWLYIEDGNTLVSIVGGASGLYGDGVNTFEMWDFREDSPQGYLTEDEINEHFKNKPLLKS